MKKKEQRYRLSAVLALSFGIVAGVAFVEVAAAEKPSRTSAVVAFASLLACGFSVGAWAWLPGRSLTEAEREAGLHAPAGSTGIWNSMFK